MQPPTSPTFATSLRETIPRRPVTHGQTALLIDMGFSERPPIHGRTSWADVYESQQNSGASLLLIIGAPEGQKPLEGYFHEWNFSTVNADSYNLHCAWDPTIWNPPSQCATIHLAPDTYAMSIQLASPSESGASPPTGDETFQLLLTKLTGVNIRLSHSTAEEGWHKLMNNVITSRPWIIAGDLALNNCMSIWNRIASLDEKVDTSTVVRKVDTSTNISDALAVVSCDMDLIIADALEDSQSMVFNICAARGDVQPPASKHRRTGDHRPGYRLCYRPLLYNPGYTSCVQPPTWRHGHSQMTALSRSPQVGLSATTQQRIVTHGHTALLIDMGYWERPPIHCTMSWTDVYDSQQKSSASLLLLIGAPDKWNMHDPRPNWSERGFWAAKIGRYFHKWNFATVSTGAYNLHCAWDPTIWSPPKHCATMHLTRDMYAMTIQLVSSPESGASPPTDDETFQLILTKLTGGRRLIESVAEDCWHKLMRNGIISRRWIIAGDLGPNNWRVIRNRFADHDEDEMVRLRVGFCENESDALAVVSSDMDLLVVHSMGDEQSMVFKFLTARGGVQPPASENESSRGSADPPTSSDHDMK